MPSIPKPIPDTLSRRKARRIYNLIGKRYDWFSFYEARAKARAMHLLDLQPGHLLLNVGLGTGKEHLALQSQLSPGGGAHGGAAFGVDISPAMLKTAYQRTGAPLCEADGGFLPYQSHSFDRLYCAYVLDLIPLADIPGWLAGFRRVLKPGGRVVLLCLTEGVDHLSRAIVSLWKGMYALSPAVCAGCRPLLLADMARQAGFDLLEREVVVQFGVASEILVAAPGSAIP